MRERFSVIAVVCFFASSAAAQSGETPSAPPETSAPSEPAAAPSNRPDAPALPSVVQKLEAPPPSAAATGAALESQREPTAGHSAEPEPASGSDYNLLSRMQFHGFVSEGGFVSTANEYIGTSSRGSLKMLEVGANFSVQLLDQLRVGMQLVVREVGTLSEDVPRLDWAVADYRFQAWLGLRAGVIKLPLGLYNEYEDIDSARTAILMPQSLYPIRNRDALISHTGFALYGDLSLGGAGNVDYQAWLGTLSIPRSALEVAGATLNSVDTKYVTGGQLFWHPPLPGLRLGGTFMQASIDFDLTLAAASVTQLVMAGALPAGSNGMLMISQRPTTVWVASAEYIRGDWQFAAEYGRWLKHQQTSLPQIIPAIDEDSERFYAMATYRLSSAFEFSTYYSVVHADVHDRTGDNPKFMPSFRAFQRDLAATIRFDVNEYWLWKVEAHYIDGVSELQVSENPNPEQYWGLFLFRTTVTF